MENNTRKEPTFGNPTQPTPENIEKALQQAKQQNVPLSVHSTQSPGHTFTPVMTRPNELAKDFATMEERKILNTAEKALTSTTSAANTSTTAAAQANTAQPAAANTNIGKTVQTSHFAFTPAENKEYQQNRAVESTTTTATPNAATAAATASATMHNNVKSDNTANSSTMERVIPTQSATVAPKTEKKEKVPSKYRRLILVGLLALALLLVFFLLKPKAPETVEALQNQGTDLPIEFRPLDEAEAKRAEEEAKALQAQQEAEQQAQMAEQQSTDTAESSENVSVDTTQAAVQTSTQQETAQTTEVVATSKPVNVEPIKPATQGSVIHQPEAQAKTLKPATSTTANKTTVVLNAAKSVTQPTTAVKNTNTAATAQRATQPAKPSTTAVNTAGGAAAKSVTQTTTAVKNTNTVATTQQATQPAKPSTSTVSAAGGAVATKSFTIDKGVSLFQKFRDNGLGNNLSELNAMGKVNNATSRLSPGQKITVRLDKNNHIVEMNLGSNKYIRQTDGSYIYK